MYLSQRRKVTIRVPSLKHNMHDTPHSRSFQFRPRVNTPNSEPRFSNHPWATLTKTAAAAAAAVGLLKTRSLARTQVGSPRALDSQTFFFNISTTALAENELLNKGEERGIGEKLADGVAKDQLSRTLLSVSTAAYTR